MSVAIQWFENSTFDAPELKSPQPCIHGAGCVYTKTLPDGKIVPAVCRYVHPGEEGKGRRLFPARTVNDVGPDGDGKFVQPACVRLIGNALYYERMRMRMPWQAFCAVRGIPFTANKPGVYRESVRRVPIGDSKPKGSPQNRARFQSPPPPRPSTEVPIRHMRTLALVAGLPVHQDFLITANCVTLLKPEEAVRFGLCPEPPSAVPTADQSWPVLGGGGGGALQRETAEEEARAAGGHDDEAYSDYDDCPQKMRGKRPYAYKRYVNEQKEAARLGVWAAKAAAAFTAEVAAAKAAEQAVPDSTAPEQAEPDCTAPEQAAARLGVALAEERAALAAAEEAAVDTASASAAAMARAAAAGVALAEERAALAAAEEAVADTASASAAAMARAAAAGVALNVAAAAEAAAIAAQSEQQKAARWAKQLEYARAHKIYVTQQRAAHEATRRREQEIYAQRVSAGEWLPGMTTLLKPIPHAVVESEVIAASNPPLQAEAAGEAVDRAMEKAQPLAPGVAGAEQAEPDCSAAEQAAAIAAQSHQQKAAPLGLAWQPNIYVKIGKNRYPIRL